MKIEGSVALVTGANRGIGKAFVEVLRDRGATRIYATARRIDSLAPLVASDPRRIVPLALDVTDVRSIRAAAEQAKGVTLLVNNAGATFFSGFLGTDDLAPARAEMEINYFGPLTVIRAFAPQLKASGDSAIVNIGSIASLITFPSLGSYSASKAAVHSLTKGVRAELRAQGTVVVGVYPGPVDTDMAKGMTAQKVPPAHIAEAALAAVVDGTEDVFPDDVSAKMYADLQADPKGVERQMAELYPA
jgi:NAD(P)-dependent dehydrogenase (short-subunit alcohol dehydrogenase family)